MSFKHWKDNNPTGPHLATVIDDSGDMVPIIPGMALFVITKPGDNNSVMPFIVHSVSANRITLALKLLDGSIQLYPFKCDTKVLANHAAQARAGFGKKAKNAS
jgi:hypothetical protein